MNFATNSKFIKDLAINEINKLKIKKADFRLNYFI
jgi:hypothetical protein